MTRKKLEKALSSVDWNANIRKFLKDTGSTEILANCNLRLAYWAKQFENSDKGNPALAFIREMQVCGYYVSSLIGLALYKPAGAAMRTVLETALYYTYFRSHPSELATLIRDDRYFIYKADLIEYHKKHTPDFMTLQNYFELVVNLNSWYSKISSIIHGQIPGGWLEHKSLAEIRHITQTLPIVVETFREGEQIVHHLFLCTVGRELWDGFSSVSQKLLLKGISGKIKTALGLYEA